MLPKAAHRPASASSSLVHPGPWEKLHYNVDENGTRICDFSYAGYKGGGVPIPDVPTAIALSPQEGDDTKRIQAAVDKVGSLPKQENGYRGAVLLRQGRYEITRSINIRHSGVVIRGEGAGFGGTWIVHRCLESIPDPTPPRYVHYPQPEHGIEPTFMAQGGELITRKTARIIDDLIPAGCSRLTLSDTSQLSVGQKIMVIGNHTQKWVDALRLQDHWKPEELTVRFPREIKKIQGHTIVLNVPITSRIDQKGGYANGEVHRIEHDQRLAHIGIEDLMGLSDFDPAKKGKQGYYIDENHPNSFAQLRKVRDSWVRRCVGFFYSSNMVLANDSQHVTVEDCAMLDGVSQDTPVNHRGSRKYYYNANGNHILVQRCYARYARHAFIGNGPKGGCAFVDCYSEKDHLPSEWHARWGHGHIFDNIFTQAPASTLGFDDHSHGQKAAFSVWWNCFVDNRRTWEKDVRVNAQPPLCQNYMIGIVHQGSGEVGARHRNSVGSIGVLESLGNPVRPRSLYFAQLKDRRGAQAVRAVTTPTQRKGPRGAVWRQLANTFSRLPEWRHPSNAPWEGWENWTPEFETHSNKQEIQERQ